MLNEHVIHEVLFKSLCEKYHSNFYVVYIDAKVFEKLEFQSLDNLDKS